MKIKLSLFFLFVSGTLFSQLTTEFINLKPLYARKVTFNYTGSLQTWTVPTDVFSILITANGAQGGDNAAYIGGKGGNVKAILRVTPGQTFYIVVGGKSTNNVPKYGFGGAGGALAYYPTRAGKAGGGLTGLFTSTTINQTTAILIAAGGGGATTYPSGIYTTYGAGGGLLGRSGYSFFNYSYGQVWGLGATQTAGGARGIPYDSNQILPTAGTALQGGKGGSGNGASYGWLAGGGGGAGYFGGGGGCAGGNAQGSGGGGSSFAIPTLINLVHTENFNVGDGFLIINY